ncbi:MAG: hypothetical protein M1482_07585 [Chloroflexi bacterium]|nr:hypothetical protein [Chloroflexota bacterium]
MPSSQRIHEPFVLAALGIALTAGFGYAAIIAATLAVSNATGGGVLLGTWWIALVQAHGHAQLFGWAGLFIAGVGLFFLPRLRGTTLARAGVAPWALGLLACGISFRVVCQPLLAVAETSIPPQLTFVTLGRLGLASSAVLELVGYALVVLMLASSFRRAPRLTPSSPFVPVRGFLVLSFASITAAVLLDVILCVGAALQSTYIFPSSLDDALNHLAIYGFVIPIAIALSIRNLPLFMRLAFPPKELLGPILFVYAVGLALRVASLIEQQFTYLAVSSRIGGIGQLLEGTALLFFVWEFDVLLRRKTSWLVSRTPPPPGYVESRRPTRAGYPDYGEYGRFELLVISAFAWLAFAAAVMTATGIGAVLGLNLPVNPDVEHHAITVGFVTLLIFAMAARMLPGFSGKRAVASPRLVLATACLGNLAAIFRVLPLFATAFVPAEAAFGISGAVGWAAVACLAVNLWRTWRL